MCRITDTDVSDPNIEDITGGYVVGSFDILDDVGSSGYKFVGEFRWIS